MEHPDWPAFVAAIVADPDDDTARLVAADFLEENGDPDRAAFIRIQVQLARLDAGGQGKSLEADDLRKKERAFLGPLSTSPGFWGAQDCPELVTIPTRGGGRDALGSMTFQGAERLTWRRGFMDAVTCSVEEWSRHGEAVRRRNPIRTVRLTGCGTLGPGEWWGLFPTLHGLSRLIADISDYPWGGAGWGLAWIGGHLPGVKVEAGV